MNYLKYLWTQVCSFGVDEFEWHVLKVSDPMICKNYQKVRFSFSTELLQYHEFTAVDENVRS